MAVLRLGAWGLLCLALAPLPLLAAPPPPALAPEAPAVRDALALAARIDQLIEAAWKENGVKPAAPASDAEFLRRLHLDLAGRIPQVSDVHRFLRDPSPDKRLREVERLLGGPRYVEHFVHTWRMMLLPQTNNQFFQGFGPPLEVWLRKQFRANTPYDKLVRELVTFSLLQQGQGIRPVPPPLESPMAFYQANEFKPENLAAATSRLFLGVKLECAQCHDHPFQKRLTRTQFWEYAAFFSGIKPGQGGFSATEQPERRSIKIGDTDKEVTARFLGGKEPEWKDNLSTRQVLADWMTRPDNPYFARNAANRMWAHFFGTGLIEPIDEPGDENPPSHPELLDLLAREFAAHDFDLKFLIRAITLSKAYGLSSALTDPSQKDARLFARMGIKGLTPEQLYDSLALATGLSERPAQGRNVGQFGSARAEFLNKFANFADKRTEHQTSILQALTLMNGKVTADATSFENGATVASVADMPWMTTAARVEALFLAALSRKPTDRERARFVAYVEKGGPSGDRNRALADVLWVLVNTSEFGLNH